MFIRYHIEESYLPFTAFCDILYILEWLLSVRYLLWTDMIAVVVNDCPV